MNILEITCQWFKDVYKRKEGFSKTFFQCFNEMFKEFVKDYQLFFIKKHFQMVFQKFCKIIQMTSHHLYDQDTIYTPEQWIVTKINDCLFPDLFDAYSQWIPQSHHFELEAAWPPITWPWTSQTPGHGHGRDHSNVSCRSMGASLRRW